MGIENLTLIGTSHIARESVQEVTAAITEKQPNLVAVELDKRRLAALLTKKKSSKIDVRLIPKIGLKGFLFMVIAGWFQSKLGKLVKLEPGADMKAAVLTAKKHNIQVALIDQDITITLRKLSRYMTWRERFRFGYDLFKGMFRPQKTLQDMGLDQFDLNSVPTHEVIEKMMDTFKDRYPTIYKVLVAQRNTIMAKRLYRLLVERPNEHIIAVVGAGHKKEMERIIKSLFDANGGVTYKHSVSV